MAGAWGAAASGAAGTVGAPGTATPAAVLPAAAAGAAAPPSAGLVAEAIWLSSDMLRCSSAVRDAWSSDCFCLARRSSASTPLTAPLDRVSLSGAAVDGLRSSTWAWTLPDASRLAEATGAAGAALANWRRNWLKSRDWAATIWRASRGEVAWAVASSGTVSTAPERMRFTLPLMKTLGLVRSMATSIWSSETPAGRWVAAMRPAVSPTLMRTSEASDDAGGAAARSRAAGAARRWAAGAGRLSSVLPAAACGAACDGAGAARRGAAAGSGAEAWAAAVTAGGSFCRVGGSSSRV